MITKLVERLTVRCEDNDVHFCDGRKIARIEEQIDMAGLSKIFGGRLTNLYSKRSLLELKNKKVLVISSHIDTVYKSFFAETNGDFLCGTLDNSVTNAVLVDTVCGLNDCRNVIYAFTGNEEKRAIGAAETAAYLKANRIDVSAIITLDITAEGYDNYDYTIENYFFSKSGNKLFADHYEFKKYLTQALKNENLNVIHYKRCAPDESWQYGRYGFNCFSFCIPSRKNSITDNWMHDDSGIIIKLKALYGYGEGLRRLIKKIQVN